MSLISTFYDAGVYPIRVVLAHRPPCADCEIPDDAVAGFIEVHHDEYEFAEWISYHFTGSLSDGALDLDVSDRVCGNGEQEGLCYPEQGIESVFRVQGSLSDNVLSLDQVEVIGDPGYPVDIPFTGLTSTLEPNAFDGAPVPIEGAWTGMAWMPTTAIYPLPLPMPGNNSMQVDIRAIASNSHGPRALS